MTFRVMIALLFAALLLQCGETKYKVASETIEYKQGDETFEGYVAYPEGQSGELPAVLIVHQWIGLTDNEKGRADQLAEMGYVAFAMDMYGKGVRAKDHEEAAQLSGIYGGDRPLMRTRLDTAMSVLTSMDNVNASKVAAMGYCFGGMSVIELALAGGDVQGVVSFHGMLMSPNLEQDAGGIDIPIVVHHGADDPFMKPEVVENFKNVMTDAKVDMEFVAHPGAVHSFTEVDKGDDPSNGQAYNKAADEKSWASMKAFFKKILG